MRDLPTVSRNSYFVRGFTLVEVAVALAIVALLASTAFPAYTSYLRKQKVRVAQTDLVALSLSMENYFQQQLAYPAATAAGVTDPTASLKTTFPGWTPAQSSDFKYLISAQTGTSYTLQAVATSSALANCTVQLNSTNDRTLTAGCGFSTTWL